jgi:hypothetical protein
MFHTVNIKEIIVAITSPVCRICTPFFLIISSKFVFFIKRSNMNIEANPVRELFAAVDGAAAELLALISPLREDQINSIPFKDSWTAAQLATHVIKSNNAIAQAMDLEGKLPGRKPAEREEELKKIFLDFNHKLKSPAFIVPRPGLYEKEKLIASLIRSNEQLKEKREQVNLSEVIEFSAFGKITRLELFYFVLYHTQRHIHQLKKILQHL